MNQFVLIFLKNFIKKNWTNIPSVRIQIQVITSEFRSSKNNPDPQQSKIRRHVYEIYVVLD